MNNRGNSPYGRFVVMSVLGMLLVVPAYARYFLQEDPFTWHIANIGAAAIVAVQGLVVIRAMWSMERRNAAAFPIATSYFTVQHVAFGIGGLALSLSDNYYFYENDHGRFSFAESLFPLLLAHFVAMNAGLVGIWLATGRLKGDRHPERYPRGADGSFWTWNEMSTICIASLAIHGAIDFVFLLPPAVVPPIIGYPAAAMYATANAAFLLWGLVWKTCRSKWILFVYSAGFLVLELIRGQRGNFLTSAVLFGVGYLTSNAEFRVRAKDALAWLPVFAVLIWCFNKAENVRVEFSRGVPESSAEALDRLGSMTASETGRRTENSYLDAQGVQMNSLFRIASRICETSAMDVVARTPDSVPFYGWTQDDWSDLFTNLIPLKWNSGPQALSDHASVLFLHDYGWSQIDPELGNAMPGTTIGDAWRRFGWAGITVGFFLWGWVLAAGSRALSRFEGPFIGVLSASIVANIAFLYTADIVSVISITPRRLLLGLVYTAIILSVQAVISPKSLRSLLPSGYAPLPQLPHARPGVRVS